ncbi:hypothetical protein TREES_T100014773 [Tupaia chinensis]|uniref:Uncharacterized protein n=1 Tax=Tupaia chinensis TaxID=246437 RepID=L9KYI7_TUPCH|nr:hypothetical protein TREES_T100014773 [Tupaia chinensis]
MWAEGESEGLQTLGIVVVVCSSLKLLHYVGLIDLSDELHRCYPQSLQGNARAASFHKTVGTKSPERLSDKRVKGLMEERRIDAQNDSSGFSPTVPGVNV